MYNSDKVVVSVNRIKELRVAKGWTQAELGQMLNCSDVAIGRYENGKRGIDISTICRLCEIFDCTADYLIGRSPLRTSELDPEEEALLLAWRASDQRGRDSTRVALSPFWQDADAGKVISFTSNMDVVP